MSSVDCVFKSLSKLPLKCKYYTPKPSFYPKHSNSIIIATDSDEVNPGVFKYNLGNNNLEMLQQIKMQYVDIKCYNNTVQLEEHGQFIDYNNNTLHIIWHHNNSHAIMDLKTKIMNYKHELEFHCENRPKSVQISTKSQEIHVVTDSEPMNHFKFDSKGNDFITIDSKNDQLNGHSLYDLKLLYIETKEQLMILGADNNDCIYYYNIKEANQWKLMNNIFMPHIVELAEYYDVLLFCDVIMVFYFDKGKEIYDIWCLDLLCYKWYKSKYNVPKSVGSNSFFIQSNNNLNDIHILDFYNQLHFMVNIYDLFSNDMIKQRRKNYEILVIGFVKDQEKNMILNIPWVVKQLILLFYPLFG